MREPLAHALALPDSETVVQAEAEPVCAAGEAEGEPLRLVETLVHGVMLGEGEVLGVCEGLMEERGEKVGVGLSVLLLLGEKRPVGERETEAQALEEPEPEELHDWSGEKDVVGEDEGEKEREGLRVGDWLRLLQLLALPLLV